ncbi:MAG: outer membrane beta-barrel protein [Ferruginibacter sp.]
MKFFISLILLLMHVVLYAQEQKPVGVISGNVLESEKEQPLNAATVSLVNMGDTATRRSIITDKNGYFLFESLPFGFYRISIAYSGYPVYRIDSIRLRADRSDFNLNEIRLTKKTTDMETVVIYAEKPLFENKDGKLTFNVSESALSNGSSATELLKQTPLVSVDADGKVQLKGKDVKILIDDKPVDLDSRQLQDLLESMSGSMIEKIEVLTTPPPQYANERGGVINIVTKKGRIGFNARINVSYGTRGEAGLSGSLMYKKNKFNLNFTPGISCNKYIGNSYSIRQNLYADSSNYLRTDGNSNSENLRPNARFALDYEMNKHNLLGIVLTYNANDNEGEGNTQYRHKNFYGDIYRNSRRSTLSDVESQNPAVNFSYTHKGKNTAEQLRFFAGYYKNNNRNERNFYQQFLEPDGSFTGNDSMQLQQTFIDNNTLSVRLNYEKPLNKKWFVFVGSTLNDVHTNNELNTLYRKKPENSLVKNDLLSNEFNFYQLVITASASARYFFNSNFFINVGMQQEYANTHFDILDNRNHYRNEYYSSLPYANITKKWEKGYNLTLSYKRSIQRPGINNLNPSVDYSDPYNTRSGNPFLQPYFSDNFDLGAGYWTKKYNINISGGYNALQGIYSIIRTLQPDGKTYITWENLSGRKEYEGSVWGGFSISKKIKTNLSSAYTYNVYSLHDRTINRYRNGGSLHSSANIQYAVNSLMNATGNFTYNRFANPQGIARNTLSMNIGVQQKFFKKNLTVSLNLIDPFGQQKNNNFVYGPNYILESYSTTNTRNFKITVGYTFRKPTPKKTIKPVGLKPKIPAKV